MSISNPKKEIKDLIRNLPTTNAYSRSRVYVCCDRAGVCVCEGEWGMNKKMTEKHDEREIEIQWIGEGEGSGTRDVLLLRERKGGRGIYNELVILQGLCTRPCTYPMIFCLYVYCLLPSMWVGVYLYGGVYMSVCACIMCLCVVLVFLRVYVCVIEYVFTTLGVN